MHKAPKTVTAYIAAAPKEAQAHLRQLRTVIRAVAPKASEGISYQIPYYKYNGMLIAFGAFKKHCSLFPGGSTGMHKKLRAELKPYKTSVGTLQFAHDRPLPVALIKKVVTLRLKENRAGAYHKK
ncbi:MAG: DUF1801 domain-containing protein [Candidatus Andersenbacteria bacterium]